MEIMNYEALLVNAQAVKVLVNKTIECSKDYTDSQADGIVEQIAEYIAKTLNDILNDPICLDPSFRQNACTKCLDFARYGGSGEGAQAQFFFSYGGTLLRLYLNETSYWWADKRVTGDGLKQLIHDWPYIKKEINDSLQCGIQRYNRKLSDQLSRQLELHDAVKNFQI